jgi:tetratricopeptide (TPR) repeat protein
MNTLHRCLSAVLLNTLFLAAGIYSPPAYAIVLDVPAQPPQIDEQPPPRATTSLEQLPPETRGDLLMTRRQYLSAISAYKLASTSPVLQNKIGIAYHQMFDLLDARHSYEQALRMNPKYAEALNNLGTVYYAQHDFHKAERLYRQSLRISPDAASVYSNLGTVYFAEGNGKKGTAAYQKALELDSSVFERSSCARIDEQGAAHERAQMSYALAKTFAQVGRNDKALEYLRIAIDQGFDDRKKIMGDKEFAGLRATPEFQRLMTAERLQ